MSMKKRVAIYARVSTLDKQEINTQVLLLKEYVSKREDWELVDVFTDKMSGSTTSRPALDEMINKSKKRAFDIILVYKFDRLGRSISHLINSLQLFESLGIAFCSYSENFDTGSPIGKVLFAVISAFAEFERNVIGERVRAGLLRCKMEGKILGRPKKDVDVERIKILRKQGLTIRQIADALSMKRSTVFCNLK